MEQERLKPCRNNMLTSGIAMVAVVCVFSLAVSASAFDSAWRDRPEVLHGGLTASGGAAPASGVGIGQLGCAAFSEAAQKEKSGEGDGLYFAFLAWRDGYISAATTRSARPTVVLDLAKEWLHTFCDDNPNARFAHAVATFTRQINNTQIAQL